MANNKVGIVCDNYKVAEFKKRLIKAGFNKFNVSAFTKESTSIIVEATPDKQAAIKKVCKEAELHFKRSN